MKNLCRVSLAALTTVVFMAALSGVASADTSSTLTIVGTSDVSDSGLMANLIEPQFHAEYPQYTFKYVGSATGTAINSAENGTGGPSVLIVHAPSLENLFVNPTIAPTGASSYSYNGQYGNAIFTNDFVLAGTTAAPDAVPAADAHNIAQAFADVAAAGVAGNATFISRGGNTTASGTTVEEHALWQLMYTSGLTPAGVTLCTVSAPDGGGMSPTNQGTNGAACPDSGTVTQADAPTWYSINSGASQGLNVTTTNACTFTAPANHCYSLTDRGTFDFLASGDSPAAGATGIPNLSIAARDNSASAPGGANALINYFHAYIINPNVAGETVNLPAAQAFVAFLTSPAFQSQLKTYLDFTTDTGGAPFKADASPVITQSGIPATAKPGQSVTVTGSVTNAEPGYPVIPTGTPVSVDETVAGVPISIATSTTNASGNYSITFTPPSSGSYQVETGQISEIANATLSPAYGDILSPAASTATTISLGASVTITKYTTSTSGVSVSGALGLASPNADATVTVLARKQGSTGSYKTVGTETLAKGAKTYALNGALSWGKWQIKVSYQDAGQFKTATSGTRNITVPVKSQTVKYKKVTVTKGKIKLTGTLSQGPVSTKATVTLMALQAGNLTFKKVGSASVKAGKTSYTITGKLASGHSYALQLKYTHSGQTAAYSKLRAIKVK